MNKIIIIGCPGSGKSTFARKLHTITDIPQHYLDMMCWNSNKTKIEKSIFIDRLKTVMNQDTWIIDGNYQSTMEMRISACDTVIFLDYPLEVCLSGIRERQGKPREDMPWVETEDDEEFLEFIKGYIDNQRPKVLSLLEKYNDKNVIVFTSRSEANEFLSRIGKLVQD